MMEAFSFAAAPLEGEIWEVAGGEITVNLSERADALAAFRPASVFTREGLRVVDKSFAVIVVTEVRDEYSAARLVSIEKGFSMRVSMKIRGRDSVGELEREMFRKVVPYPSKRRKKKTKWLVYGA